MHKHDLRDFFLVPLPTSPNRAGAGAIFLTFSERPINRHHNVIHRREPPAPAPPQNPPTSLKKNALFMHRRPLLAAAGGETSAGILDEAHFPPAPPLLPHQHALQPPTSR